MPGAPRAMIPTVALAFAMPLPAQSRWTIRTADKAFAAALVCPAVINPDAIAPDFLDERILSSIILNLRRWWGSDGRAGQPQNGGGGQKRQTFS